MSLQFQSPLSGGPRTTQTRDAEGRPIFTIHIRALTPLRAKIVDVICDLFKVALWLAFAALVVLLYAAHRLTLESFGAVVISLGATYFSTRGALRLVLRKRTVIRMTVDAVSVRGWWGWKHFERAMRHTFIVVPHDLIQWEQEKNNLKRRQAAQKGRVIQPRAYFDKSAHVVLVYAGHRVDLATIFDHRRAAPIASRLQYVDELLSVFEGKSRGPDDGIIWTAPEPGAWQS
jgi:hypothetical protein